MLLKVRLPRKRWRIVLNVPPPPPKQDIKVPYITITALIRKPGENRRPECEKEVATTDEA